MAKSSKTRREPQEIRSLKQVADEVVARENAPRVKKGKKSKVTFAEEISLDSKGRQSAKGLPCLFSGEQTITPKAKFLPGFDAKLKSVLLRVEKGTADASEIPALARQWMQKEPLVGFRMEGNDLVRVA